MSWRQLVKTVRYSKGTKGLASFLPRSGKADSIEAYLDGVWAFDDIDRKSETGGYLMWLSIAQPQQDDWTTFAQQWRKRNHEHERVVERSQIDVIQS